MTCLQYKSCLSLQMIHLAFLKNTKAYEVNAIILRDQYKTRMKAIVRKSFAKRKVRNELVLF